MDNINLLIFYLFNSSVPTPALTDDITVNWEPLTPAKNQIYRIDLKQSMDAEHNLDRIKYVMEINLVLSYKNRIKFDICQIDSIVYLTFSDFGKRTSQSYSRRKKRCKRRRKNCREMLSIRKILVLYFIFSKY